MKHGSNTNTNMKKTDEKTWKEKKKSMSSMVFLIYSVIVVIFAGLFLTYWVYKYHPTNSNLWMVPVGLIFLVTPAFLSISVLVSDLCDDDGDGVNHDLNQIKIVI
ncbi:hypothetical protein Bca4012_097389 [Brassica carinata]|uniref:Transmembrane protein n=1 Tax=Brassica oleracea TaxID=3712 RepID=A0A3P6FNA4_BRAOL|nr:unnamed protein product [Brassica oleracea]